MTTLRVFAARDGEAYTVMPGGLTRVAGETSPVVSMQLGAGSKDTWVLAGEVVRDPAPVPAIREAYAAARRTVHGA